MINQERIHQRLIMSLSSMNKIISCSEKLNERRNEFFKSKEFDNNIIP